MTIALYAMFVGLLVPSMKKSVKVTFFAVVAGCLNSILLFTTNLSNGWSIVTATLVSAVIVRSRHGEEGRRRSHDESCDCVDDYWDGRSDLHS